jgi:hypothetical protein
MIHSHVLMILAYLQNLLLSMIMVIYILILLFYYLRYFMILISHVLFHITILLIRSIGEVLRLLSLRLVIRNTKLNLCQAHLTQIKYQ